MTREVRAAPRCETMLTLTTQKATRPHAGVTTTTRPPPAAGETTATAHPHLATKTTDTTGTETENANDDTATPTTRHPRPTIDPLHTGNMAAAVAPTRVVGNIRPAAEMGIAGETTAPVVVAVDTMTTLLRHEIESRGTTLPADTAQDATTAITPYQEAGPTAAAAPPEQEEAPTEANAKEARRLNVITAVQLPTSPTSPPSTNANAA